jgi:hypothetical protein
MADMPGSRRLYGVRLAPRRQCSCAEQRALSQSRASVCGLCLATLDLLLGCMEWDRVLARRTAAVLLERIDSQNRLEWFLISASATIVSPRPKCGICYERYSKIRINSNLAFFARVNRQPCWVITCVGLDGFGFRCATSMRG